MALIWREVARAGAYVAFAADAATLLVEAARGGVGAPDLSDAIARLAPHVVFDPVAKRERVTERTAIVGDERLTIGRYRRGAVSVAYLLAVAATAEGIRVTDFLALRLGDTSSPFDHLAD